MVKRTMCYIVTALIICSIGSMFLYWIGRKVLNPKAAPERFQETYAFLHAYVIALPVLLIGTAIVFGIIDQTTNSIMLLIPSRPVRNALLALFWIWAAGAVWNTCRIIRDYRKVASAGRNCRPAEESVKNCAAEIAKKLSMGRTPDVLVSSTAAGPYSAGLLRQSIILPDIEYSATELSVILLHELTHCRCRDNWYRKIAVFEKILFWFHPVLWKILNGLAEWDERHCDFEAVLSGVTDDETYSSAIGREILRIAESRTQITVTPALSLLCPGHSFKERYQFMKNCRKIKKLKKSIAMLIFTGTLLFGCVLSAAAGTLLNAANDWDLNHTDRANLGVQEEILPDLEEHSMTAAEAAAMGWTVAELDGDETEALPYGPISWTVVNGTERTGQFTATSTQAIAVVITAATPATLTYDIGIVEPDNSTRWISPSGPANHTFYLDQSGSYRVFVRNTTSTSLKVSGFYSTSDAS